MSIESVMPSNDLILCHCLLLLPSIFPSIKVFSNGLPLCIRWPKYWNFSISIRPFNECSGLISLRIDWFDILAVQGNLLWFTQLRNSGGRKPVWALGVQQHGIQKSDWALVGCVALDRSPNLSGPQSEPWISWWAE